MKKIYLLLTVALSAFGVSCTTNVGVESSADPIGTFDLMTGTFYGQIAGTVPTVFKATNIALEQDLGYMRTGQYTDSPTKNKVRARTTSDQLIVVVIIQREDGLIEVQIEQSDGDLMSGQKVFNAIAKETRKLTNR